MGEILAFKTRGGSMRPLLKSGDVAFIQPCSPDKIKAGDMVAYRDNGRVFLHRLWGKRKASFIIGDDGGVIDVHTIESSQIVGKAIHGPNGLPGLIWGKFFNILFKSLRKVGRIPAIATLLSYLRKQVSRFNWNNNKSFIIKSLKWIPAFQTVSQVPKAVIASDRRERGNLNLLSKGEIASVALLPRKDVKNELRHSLFAGMTGLRTLLQIRRCTQLPLRNHLKPILRWLFLSSLVFLSVHPMLHAVTRQKTVEWSFGICPSTAVATATKYTMPVINFRLPDAVTVKNAWLEFDSFSENGNDITAIDLFFDQGAAANTIRDAFTGATLAYNTGESLRFHLKCNIPTAVFANVTANNNYAAAFRLTATSGNFGQNAMKLYVTYEYDDTAPVQVNTVHFPIKSNWSSSIASALSSVAPGALSFTYNAEIAESGYANFLVKQQWFEVRGHRLSMNAATDGTIVSRIGTNAYAPSMTLDGSLIDSYDFFYLSSSSTQAGFSVNSQQTLNIETTQNTVYNLGGECVVTYECAGSAVVKTKTVNYLVGQSATGAAASFPNVNLNLEEGGVNFKALYARILGSYNGTSAGNVTWNYAVNGVAGNQVYTHNTQAAQTGVHPYFLDLWSTSPNTTWYNGCPVALSYTPSVAANTGAIGAELTATYQYTEALKFTDSSKIFAYQSGNGVIISTTLAFPTFTPIIENPEGRKALASDYLSETFLDQRNGNTITANPTLTLNINSSAQSITAQPATGTEAILFSAIYTDPLHLLTTNNVTLNANADISVNNVLANGIACITYSYFPPPNSPNYLNQYEADAATFITTGTWVSDTTAVLKMNMTSRISDTLTPVIEALPLSTSFTGTNVSTGSSVAFSSTTAGATGTITVTGLTNGTTYHWRARVFSANGISNWVSFGGNPETSIDFGVDLSSPTMALNAPLNQSATNQAAVNFQWTGTELPATYNSGVNFYAMQVSTDPGFGSIAYSSITARTSVSATLSQATYYWCVSATDNAENIGDPASYSFVLDTTAPSVPSLSQPLDTGATNQLAVNFQWNPSDDSGFRGNAGINGYDISISTDANFTVYSSSGYSTGDSLSRTVPRQNYYYWKVRAKDNAQNYGFWSSTWAVRVDTTAPPTPTLATPLADFATNYATVPFTWNTVSDTSTGNSGTGNYELYIATVPGFAPLLYSTQTLSTSFAYTCTQETTYYWQVRAYDLAGNASGWAASRYLQYDVTVSTVQRNTPPDSQQTPPRFHSGAAPVISFTYTDTISRLNELKYSITSQPDGGGTTFVPWTLVTSSPVAVSSYTATISPSWASLTEWATNYVHLYYSDRAGNYGIWNNAFDILKDTTAPPVPALTKPIDVFKTNLSSVTFSWSTTDLRSGTSYYILQVSTMANFVPVKASSQTALSNASLTGFTTNYYYWNTMACDLAGNSTVYSSTRAFVVDIATPTMIVRAPLINGDTTWRSVNNFSYNVDFYDTGGSLLDHFDISVSTGKNRAAPFLADWTDSGVNIVSSSTYTGDWHFSDTIWQNLMTNTTNYVSLRVYDLAGNCSTYLDAFFIKKSTSNVQIINSETGQDTVWRSTSTSRLYNVQFTNSGGDIAGVQYCAYSGQNFAGTQRFNWTPIPVISASLPTPSTGNWQIGPTEFQTLADGGTSYISVRCWEAGGSTVTAQDVFFVKKDTTQPSLQSLSGPLNGAATGQQAVNFSWQAATDLASGTTQYYIQVATSTTFVPVTYSSYTSAVSLQSSALTQSTYYWEIKAKDLAGNWSVYSASWTVQVDTTPPPVPSPTSDLTGFTTNYFTQTFQWSSVTDAGPAGLSVYSFTLSTSATMSPNYSSITVNTSSTTTLSLSSTYYWNVAAVDRAQNYSNASATQSIIIDGLAPPAPSLATPNDQFASNIQSVTFNWTGADNGPSGIMQYQLQVSTDINFGVFYTTTTSLLSNTTNFQQNTLWWKVKSFDYAGNFSAFSATKTFVVDISSPPAPGNATPSNDTRANSLSRGFTWGSVTDNGPAGIQGYELAVSTDPYFGIIAYSSATALPSASLTVTSQNIFYWKTRAQDKAGNYSLYSSTFSLTIDTTTPTIAGNNQTGDDTWRGANDGSYAVQFFDTPDTAGAGLSAAQYRIYSSSTPATGAPAGTQLVAYQQNILATLPDRTSYYILPWSISGAAFSALNQGRNFVFVKSSDMAGNTTEPSSYAFYIMKDTAAPSVTNGDPVPAWESDDETHSTLITDAGAGVVVASYTACSLPNRSAGPTIPWTTVCDVPATASWNTPWNLNFTLLAPGTNYISIKTADAKGNLSISTDTFIVLKDTIPPNAVANLSVSTGTASGSLTLKWTTPADDTLTDPSNTKLTSYLVKYNAAAFTSTADFLANGTTFFNSWTPKTPGLADQQDVTGLVEGTTYFVGIAGIDKAGNAPALLSGSTNYGYAARIAPSKITDLVGTSIPDALDPGAVELTWTAVGDDSKTGTAAGYLVKYATFAFTSSQWNASNVTTFSQAWPPSSANAPEDRVAAGLTPGVTYYLAIEAYDAASPGANYSVMSNTVCVQAKPTGPADGMLCYGAGVLPNPQYYKITATGAGWTSAPGANNAAATIYWSVVQACPVIRNEKLLATLSSTGDIYTQRWGWDGVAQSWGTPVLQTTIASADAIYRPVDIAYEQTTGRAIVAWRGAAGQANYRIWSSTANAWLTSETALTMGGSGLVRWLRLEPRPGTDEIMLVTLDANNAMFAYRWNGSAWVNNTQLTVAAYISTYQSFDLAWENTNGSCLILWGEGAQTKYAQWSSQSSAWVALGSNGPQIAAGAGAYWIRLNADRASGSNNIAMSSLDSGKDWNVSVWDGAGWAAPTELSASLTLATPRMMDIAWEKDTGKCLTVGALSTQTQYVSYATWASGVWSGVTTYSGYSLGNGAALRMLQLTPGPNSNKMILMGSNAGAAGAVYLRTLQWTGSGWSNTQGSLISNGSTNAYEFFAVSLDRFDNQSPTCTPYQNGDDTWRTANTGTYDVDFFDTGGSHLAKVQSQLEDASKVTYRGWTDELTGLNTDSYTALWPLTTATWNQLHRGRSYISLRVFDGLGNYTDSVDAFYVQKDTEPPAISSILPVSTTWYATTTAPVVIATATFADQSGLSLLSTAQYLVYPQPNMGGAKICQGTIFNPPGVASEPSFGFALNAGDWSLLVSTISYVSLRCDDIVGNSTTFIDAFTVLRDTIPPSIPATPQPLDASATSQLTIAFQWNASTDTGPNGSSGINGYALVISTDINFSVISSSGYSSTPSLSRALPVQSTYYWHVQAKDNAQNYSAWSSTWTILVDTAAPPAPALATPLTDFATNYATVNFTWNTVSDTSTGNSGIGAYELYIASVPGFAPLLTSTRTLATSFTYTFAQETTCYWQVRAIDNVNNTSGWAASRYLEYDATPPAYQRNILPDSQQTPPAFRNADPGNYIDIDFSDALSRLNELKLTVTSQPDGGGTAIIPWTVIGSSPVAVSSYTANFGVTWASLQEGVTNYVHLYYSDRAGNSGTYNNAFDILKDTTPPSTPSPLTPADQVTVNTPAIAFDWTDAVDLCSGTSYYTLQIATSTTFVPVTAASQTAVSQAAIANIAENTYYWRTWATDRAGNLSLYSSTRTFLVDLSTPTMVIGAPLLNGDTTWRSVNIFTYNVDFNDGGGSLLDHFDISVSTTKGRTPPLLADWTNSGVNIVSSSTYTGDWHFPDAVWQNLQVNTSNYISLRVYDLAGNCSTYLDAFFVKQASNSVQIINSEAGQDTVWRSTSTARRYNVEFTNSAGDINDIQYCAYNGQNLSGTRWFDWTDIPVIYASLPAPSTGNWQIGPSEFISLGDSGINYISVRCWQTGGDTITARDVFYVKKDTTVPSIQALSGPLNGAATGQQTVNFSWQAATDLGSGTPQYYIQIATSAAFIPVTYSSYTSAVSLQSSALPQATYYWEIKAKDLAGNWSVYSASWTVQVDTTPPPAPNAVSPLTGFTTNYAAQTFQWSQVTDAGPAGLAAYSLILSTSATLTPVNYSSVTVNTSVTTSLALSSTYYWSVAAIDRAQNPSAGSTTQSIIVDTMAPATPSLSAPADAFAANIQPVAFTWSGADNGPSGILQYQLQVSTDINFGVFYSTLTPLLSHTTTFQEGTYWWKVKSFDNAGNVSQFASTRTFCVDLSSPPAPSNSAPTDDARRNTLSPAFSWSSVTDNGPAGTMGYALAVSTDPYFGVVSYSSSTVSTSASLTFTAQNIFFWKVRAQDRAGNYSLYSSTYSLTIDTTTPAIVNNQAGDDTWRAANAGSYAVQFFDTPDSGGAGLSAAQYRIYSSSTPATGAPAGTQLVAYQQNILATLPDRTSYYTQPWSISGAAFSALNQGYNFVFVKSSDMAGNTTEPTAYAFYVKKDTVAPSVTNGDPVSAWESTDGTHSTLITDAGAGVVVASYTACSLPNRSGGQTIPWTTVCDVSATASWNTPWSLNFTLLAPGTNYISIKTADALGNVTISTDTFIVLKDTIPPNAVANLSVSTGTASGSLTLKWTTPADDSFTDISSTKVASYLVKYKATAFASTADFLANGTTFFNSWTPKTPGLADQQDVAGLVEGTTYFVGLAGIDKAGNAPSLVSGSTNYSYALRVAPANITDLAGTSAPDTLDPGSVELSWTAVGNDGTSGGAATGYTLKYATFAFTSSQWNASNVTTFSQAWTPAAPTTHEDQIVAGLTANVTYYFAIKAYDSASPGADYSAMSSTISVMSKPTGPADGMLCYGAGTFAYPCYYKTTAAGSSWTGIFTASNTVATIYWSVLRACPVVRNEKLLATLSSTGDIYTQRWDGQAGAGAWDTPVLQTTITAGDAIYRPIDIAYEQTSGRAIVAARGGAAGQVTYRIWSSTASAWLNSATTLTMGGSGFVRWLRLEPRPGTNEIMLVTMDANKAMFAYRWDGSSWVNNTQLTLAPYTATYQCFDLAWENTRGNNVILWAESTSTKYAMWSSTASAWVAVGSAGPNIAATAGANWIKLAGDTASGSNKIAMAALDTGPHWNVSVWDGTTWAVPSELSTAMSAATSRMIDIAWEKDTGKCMAVGVITSPNSQYVSYSEWSAGAWPAITTYSNFNLGNSVALKWLQLTPDPNSNKMALIGENSAAAGSVYLRPLQWTGAAWINPQTNLVTNGTNNAYEFFMTALNRYDTVSPSCNPYQQGDDTWRSSNNGSYDVDFLDTGGSHVSKVQSQLEDSQKVMYRDWMDELTGLNSDNYTSLWPLSANTWNQLRRGKSYMSLRTFDGVGNSIDTADAFYVLKDTEPPAISSILPVSTTWYTSAAAPNTVAGATFTDQSALSLLSTAQYLIYPQTNMGGTQICQGTIFNPPGNASQSLSFGLNSGHWDLLANTSNYVTLRCYDLAGNTTIFVDAFTIMKDTIPPQAITTLQSAPGPFRATINLSWLAPGDNGSSGSNSEGLYVIKFATFAITDINLFNGASTYAQSMTPQQPKAQESITILNLDAGTTWYFSVRAMDKAHLWPGISNSTGTLPRTDNVYINEVYAAGAGSTDWVELYNSMPGAQSLAGWTLVYNQGSIDSPGSESPIWTGSGSLSSKQFLVIPSLNLNGDASWHVKLKDDQNRVVDTVQWPVAVSGKSFSRISDGNSYFEIDPTPTQGYANSLTTGTIKINEIDYASAQQFVELYNVGADTPVLANWYLRNSNANPFKFTRKIYPNTFSGADFYSIDNTAKLWTTCFGGSGLNATADYVVLENDGGQAIDRVTWKPDAGDNAVYYTYKSTPAVFGASALGGLSSPKTIGRKPSEGWDTFNNGSDFALCTGASYGSRNNGSPAAANTLSYPQSSSYLPRRFPLNLTLGANSAGGANNVLWFVRTGGSDDTKSPHIYRLSDIGFNLASLASQTTVQSGLAMIDIDGYPLVDAAAYKLIFNSDTGSNSAPQITAANVTFDATVQDAHAMAILHPWLNDDAKDGVLRIDIINRSPSSANAIELSSVTVKFTDGSGTALNTAKAQALFNSISLVVDNQSYGTIGAYQSDIDSVTIAQVNSAAFNLDGSGAQILGVSNPNGADSRVVAASTRTYFVAVTLTGSASGANPNTFKAKIIPGADTFVRDGPTDIDQAVLQGSQVMTSSPTIIVPAAPPAGTSYPAPVAPAGTQITANIQLNTGVAGAAYAGASDGKLYAINSDGTGKWSFDAGSPISRTFSSFEAGVSTCIYLATDAGMLYKVQDNGNAAAQQWSGPRDLHSAITSDIMDNGGCMYAGTANGNFYKINPANGADADPTHWVSNPGISGAINGSPVIASPNDCVSVNAVWFGTSNGTFYRLDNENGTVSISTATSTSIRTSPYISLGFTNASRNHSYIYFGDDDGYFRCRTSINLKTKPDDWTDLHVSSPIFGSPVSNYMDDNDRGIYFGADNGVFYKVDYSSGGVYWTFQTRGPIRTMPMPGNGTDIYFGSDDGCFYGINTVTGQPLSNNKFPIVTGGEVRGSPAYDATTTPNRIYFGSNDGKIYCVEVSP